MGLFDDPKDEAYEDGKDAGREGNDYSDMCERIANDITMTQEEKDAWEAGHEDGENESADE
jgi:hypothetical protein